MKQEVAAAQGLDRGQLLRSLKCPKFSLFSEKLLTLAVVTEKGFVLIVETAFLISVTALYLRIHSNIYSCLFSNLIVKRLGVWRCIKEHS